MITINTQYNYKKTNANVSFNGTAMEESKFQHIANKENHFVIDTETQTYLKDIIKAYEQISEVLDKKTSAGIKSLITESGLFNTNDGITLKNVNEQGESIAIDVINYRNTNKYIKLLVKDKNNKVKNKFLITGQNQIIKNYDNVPIAKLTADAVFYTKEEAQKLNLNNEIKNILKEVDFPLLKTRIYIEKNKNTNLKPLAATVDKETLEKIQKLILKRIEIDKLCKTIPPSTLTKKKNEHEDYVIQHGRNTHKFKNIGEDKLQIIFSEFDNPYFGNFKRLMVYNEDGTPKTGYLLKDNKIVSNFNPLLPSEIPNKLDFVDINEINAPHYKQELLEYIDAYSQKLQEFEDFLTDKTTRGFNALPQKDVQKLTILSNLYEETEKLLLSVNTQKANKIKNNCPNYDITAGKKGFTFKNIGEDKKTINVFKSKANTDDDILKITILAKNKENNITLSIKNNEKFVNNYKIKDSEMSQKLELLKYVQELTDKMKEFNESAIQWIKEDSQRKEIKRQADIDKKQKQEIIKKQKEEARQKNIKIKEEKTIIKRGRPFSKEVQQNPWIKEKEYNDMLKDCIKLFKQTMTDMKGNIEIFDSRMQEIRKNIAEFIEQKRNTES